MKNKIGWCNLTFNPVWGCRNKCPYCYARKIAKRFWKQMLIIEFGYYCDQHPSWTWHGKYHSDLLSNFKPAFLYSQFNKKFPKKPQRIFVGSMSEICYWDKEWMERVLYKIKQYPQHTFQFLTKYPFAYLKYEFPQNCWLGLTIVRTPKESEPDRWSFIEFKRNNLYNLKFVCFEPLLENIDLSYYLDLTAINWVIIGAETGNRKGKVIPERRWIALIAHYCRENDIPIYLKDSLKEIYPVEIKEFPEGVRKCLH